MEMRYPAGDKKGRELFFSLEQRAEKSLYDDEFLVLLIEYQRIYPNSEHFDIFYGRYAAFHGGYEVALEYALRAFKKRKVNLEVWNLLIQSYSALGHLKEALVFQGYRRSFYNTPLDTFSMPLNQLKEYFGELSVSMGKATYAPACRMKLSESQNQLHIGPGVFGGEVLPFSLDKEGYAFWVGAYNELSHFSGHGELLRNMRNSVYLPDLGCADFVFDIFRSQIMGEADIAPSEKNAVIVPLAATEMNQKVNFCRGEKIQGMVALGQWEYNFFRVEESVHISSNRPLVFGKPIQLGHSSSRKKIVLNILVDALSWNVLRQQNFRCMPNMMDFFSQGVIFDQCFAPSEYTYPALAAIETGMYSHHSQIFHDKSPVRLDEEYVTISERMKDLGYYCVNIMGDGSGLYNGVSRGYDRLIVNHNDLSAYVGIERVIRHLEAFSECDQFLFLHLGEAHPWPTSQYPVETGVQAKLSLEDRLPENDGTISVHLPELAIHREAVQQAMRRIDRNLKGLFEYLAEHYDEDEYLVQLYSDHGVPVFEERASLMGDNCTNVAYMIRGCGVPRRGLVEELVSLVDIYPVMANLVGFTAGDQIEGNLPAVFGGKERECVYSSSLFPGQTYKLCIRTKDYEFYMESLEPVIDDGTVDLSGAKVSIRERKEPQHLIEDMMLKKFFFERARNFTSSINHEGRQWHSMVRARPEWYNDRSFLVLDGEYVKGK